jgi:UDP-glucose 4-epimerase
LSKILITGGAGFIGSSLTDEFMRSKNQVIIYDNFSRGSKFNISNWKNSLSFKVIKADMLDRFSLSKAVDSCDIVFHLAANPEVRVGSSNTKVDYEQNVLGTYNLLEALKDSTKCKKIVFASTSTVYGEPDMIPTSENYSPLMPISLYGASKLACEALVSGYCHMFNISGIALRLANIIGPRSTHGVIWDFINKLIGDPTKLDILGDGTQNKSYLFIDDCVRAFTLARILTERNENNFDILNVGSMDRVDVLSIAKIIMEELSLHKVKLNVTGGPEGRGWNGDVKDMLLDCSKLEGLGWKATHNSAQAVYLTTRGILSKEQKVVETRG